VPLHEKRPPVFMEPLVDPGPPQAGEIAVDYSAEDLPALRQMCRNRGLRYDGDRAALAARLEAYDHQAAEAV
jgi:hypothetical protein